MIDSTKVQEGRLPINDKQNTCDHEFRIPGLEASLCGKCNRWVITDLNLIKELKYGKKKGGRK